MASIYIRFTGDGFKPAEIASELGVEILILASSGSIATRGRYKGKPSPYGMGIIEINHPTTTLNNLVSEYAEKLIIWKPILTDNGVTEITLGVNTYGDDYELDLGIETLGNLHFMEVSLEVHASSSSLPATSLWKEIRELKTLISEIKLRWNISEEPGYFGDEWDNWEHMDEEDRFLYFKNLVDTLKTIKDKIQSL